MMALNLQFFSLAILSIGLLLYWYPHFYTVIKKMPVFLSSKSLYGNGITIALPCFFGLLSQGFKTPSVLSIVAPVLLALIMIWNFTRPKTITAYHINPPNFQKVILAYLKESQIEFEKAPSMIHIMNPDLEISFSGNTAKFILENYSDWKALNKIITDIQAKNLKANNGFALILSIFGIVLILLMLMTYISISK